ncbi:hypothetical protein BCO18175_06831 [Burkholderia contaminans]|uniref:hypothetical protein n=1 Tax=Burkholderia contaminans TaxID=488447 RepID=UPI001453A180|nr:hypothetical protein [Burkholderia contaminans]VWD39983.1 hypothetical protein BCO18175_06831 [Burkholderia contaminans]
MKIILLIVLVASVLWKLSFSDWNLWAALSPFDLGTPMWGVATIYIIDFIAALRGKNSPYMIEFYGSVKKDLAVSAIWGITLFLILYFLPTKYSFSNLDIASFGMPLLIYSVFALIEGGTISIFEQRLPKRIVFSLIAMVCGSYIYFAYLLVEIGGNNFSSSKALWNQITILCTSFSAFIGSYLIRFILIKQRLEVSPVILRLFEKMPGSSGQYKLTAEMAQSWNQHVDELKEKSQNDAIAKRSTQRKKKRKKK